MFKFDFEDLDRDDANDVFRTARGIVFGTLFAAAFYLAIVFVFSF